MTDMATACKRMELWLSYAHQKTRGWDFLVFASFVLAKRSTNPYFPQQLVSLTSSIPSLRLAHARMLNDSRFVLFSFHLSRKITFRFMSILCSQRIEPREVDCARGKGVRAEDSSCFGRFSIPFLFVYPARADPIDLGFERNPIKLFIFI